MATTRELVRRRKSVRNTRKITKTMEMVATAKLAKAQAAALAARPYARRLQQVVGDLARVAGGLRHPLLETHAPVKKAAVLLFTSDRGLCGGFNANILRKARALREDLAKRGVESEWILHGKKGLGSFRYLGWPVAESYLKVSDKPDYARAEKIGERLIQRYEAHSIDEAYIVYSAFRSMAVQMPTLEPLLPLSALTSAGDGAGNAGAPAEASKGEGMGYLFHPEPARMLAVILPLVLKMSLFTAMLDSTAGEHAARRVAMQNATDAADDMIKMLTRKYNRARQSKITQEIAEIVGGAEVL